jgi:hypothetical protein
MNPIMNLEALRPLTRAERAAEARRKKKHAVERRKQLRRAKCLAKQLGPRWEPGVRYFQGTWILFARLPDGVAVIRDLPSRKTRYLAVWGDLEAESHDPCVAVRHLANAAEATAEKRRVMARVLRISLEK